MSLKQWIICYNVMPFQLSNHVSWSVSGPHRLLWGSRASLCHGSCPLLLCPIPCHPGCSNTLRLLLLLVTTIPLLGCLLRRGRPQGQTCSGCRVESRSCLCWRNGYILQEIWPTLDQIIQSLLNIRIIKIDERISTTALLLRGRKAPGSSYSLCPSRPGRTLSLNSLDCLTWCGGWTGSIQNREDFRLQLLLLLL